MWAEAVWRDTKSEELMSERMQILEMIESGEISAQEAARRLEALASPVASVHPEAAPIAPPVWVKRIWQAVFWSGATLTAGGALLVAIFYAGKAGVGSAICGWPLFGVGLLGLLLGLWLPNATWFSLRVREEGSHQELMETGGIYSRLWRLQFEPLEKGGAA